MRTSKLVAIRLVSCVKINVLALIANTNCNLFKIILRTEVFCFMENTTYFADLDSAQALELGRIDQNHINYYHNVPMIGEIRTETAFMGYRSPYDSMHPNRPYLHLMGYVNKLSGEMPYGLTNFIPSKGQYADLIYEFSNQELANLVNKGLYERDFKVPDQLKHANLKVPVNCDFAVIDPAEDDKDKQVIVFGRLKSLNDLEISSKNTDYIFANDFEKANSLLPHKDKKEADKPASLDESLLKDSAINFDEAQTKQEKQVKDHDLDDNVVIDQDLLKDAITGDEPAKDESDKKLQDTTSKPDKAVSASENKPEKAETDPDVIKMMKRAEKHINKRRKALKDQKQTDKQEQTNKQESDKHLDVHQDQAGIDKQNLIMQESRQSKLANEEEDAVKNGDIQETVPDTPTDFDAIDDDDLEHKQTLKQKRSALKKAHQNGEINEEANKEALKKKSNKEIQDLPDVLGDDDKELLKENTLD